MKHLDPMVRSAFSSRLPVPRPRPLLARTETTPSGEPSAASTAARADAGVDGVYPCPFGFALSVPLHHAERLVPATAENAGALAPIAGALALVRASGGFEAKGVRSPTAEIRLSFERVPDLPRASRGIHALGAELLALGMDALPAPEPGLGFQVALELRAPAAHSLSVHLYVEGTSSAHERLLGRMTERMLPVLTRLVEAEARVETHFILRRRVLARCRVDVARLLARLPGRMAPDPNRDAAAVAQALRWLDAAKSEPVLASAQNELVLDNVARVARALGADARRQVAEGHCHAARFGAVTPLASFALDGRYLTGVLGLPLVRDARQRRHDASTDLAHGLLRGDSIQDVGLVSTCLGLAAQLATLEAAVSLAFTGTEQRLPAPAALDRDVTRSSVLPVPIDWDARGSSLPPPPAESRPARASSLPPPAASKKSRRTPLPPPLRMTLPPPAMAKPAAAKPAAAKPAPAKPARATSQPPRAAALPRPAPAPASLSPRKPVLPSPIRRAASKERSTLLPPRYSPPRGSVDLDNVDLENTVVMPARSRTSLMPEQEKTLVTPPRQIASLRAQAEAQRGSRARPAPSTTGPARAASSLPPRPSMVAPRAVPAPRPTPSPAPPRSASTPPRASTVAPRPGFAPLAPPPTEASESTLPPPRRSREASGVHPSIQVRSNLPPPRRNPRHRERG